MARRRSGKLAGQAEALIRLVGEDGVSKMVEDVQKKIKGTAEETRKSEEATKSLEDAWAGAAAAVGIAGTAIASAVLVARELHRSLTDENRLRGMEASFERTFATASASMRDMQAASAGVFSEQDIQKWSVLMNRLGLDIGQINQILELSAKAATATGVALKDMLQEVTTGIGGRSSGFFEDKLGLPVDFGRDVSEANARLKDLNIELTTSEEVGLAATSAIKAMSDAFGGVELYGVENDLNRANVAIEEMGRRWTSLKAEAASATLTVLDSVDAVNQTRKTLGGLIQNNAEALEMMTANLREEAHAHANIGTELQSAVSWSELYENRLAALHEWHGLLPPAISDTARETRELTSEFEKQVTQLNRLAEAGNRLGDTALFNQAFGLLTKASKAIGARRRGGRGRKRQAMQFVGETEQQQSGRVKAERFAEFTATTGEENREKQQGLIDMEREHEATIRSKADALQSLEEQALLTFDTLSASAADLQGPFAVLSDEIERMSAVMEAADRAGISMGQAFIKNVPAMLSAGGKVTAGFVDNTKTKAAIQAVFEGAASVASFAKQDYTAGAMHALAALQFGLIAGGVIGGGGGGGGGARGRPPVVGNQLAAQNDDADRGTRHITINMQGALVTEEGARELERMRRRFTDDEFVPG